MTSMETTCPRCHAVTQPGDRFCPSCGFRLEPATAVTDAEIAPVPGTFGYQQRGETRRRRRRRPWFRRWRVVVPLVLVGMILLTLGAGAWYIKTRFDTLNALSTPPAEISGDRLGGDQAVNIDTNPAQDAVKEAEARREAARNQPPTPTPDPQAVAADGDATATTAPIPTQPAPVIEVNAAGTPELVSEPSGTPALATVPEPVAKNSYAFLMMGVDARPGEAIDVGVRPDSLFVVYLDGDNGSCRVLSIPRDTRTTLPGYGQSKINHALAVGGVPYEQLVVENLLGIEIQHYGLIDFSGVTKLVDAVGGVTVDNAYAFSTGQYTFPEGRIELDGDEALAYSRFRHDEHGDFGRQERQQAVVRALLTQGASMNVVSAIPSLLGSVEDHVRTDLGPNQMVEIAQDFRSTCNGSTLKTNRIDGTVAWAYDDVMKMELSFVLVDPAEVDRKVAWLLTGEEPTGTAPAPSPPATPAGSPVATPEASPAATRPSR